MWRKLTFLIETDLKLYKFRYTSRYVQSRVFPGINMLAWTSIHQTSKPICFGNAMTAIIYCNKQTSLTLQWLHKTSTHIYNGRCNTTNLMNSSAVKFLNSVLTFIPVITWHTCKKLKKSCYKPKTHWRENLLANDSFEVLLVHPVISILDQKVFKWFLSKK